MTATPLRVQDKLVIAAARIAASSPRSWEEFKQELKAMTAEKALACIQAPPDQIFNLQGQARQLNELVSLFEDAVQRAIVLEAKMKERQNGR